jgi:hypothetical protein
MPVFMRRRFTMESIDCDTREAAIRAGRLIDLGDAAPEHAESVAISRALYDRVADDPEAMAWILGAGFRGFETYERSLVPSRVAFQHQFHPRRRPAEWVEVLALFEEMPEGGLAATFLVAGESFEPGPAFGPSGVM